MLCFVVMARLRGSPGMEVTRTNIHTSNGCGIANPGLHCLGAHRISTPGACAPMAAHAVQIEALPNQFLPNTGADDASTLTYNE